MFSQQGDADWFDFWLNGHEDPGPRRPISTFDGVNSTSSKKRTKRSQEPQPTDGAVTKMSREARQSAANCEQKLNTTEEHTSELQSRLHLVCRLLLEKKKRHCQRQRHSLGGERSPFPLSGSLVDRRAVQA